MNIDEEVKESARRIMKKAKELEESAVRPLRDEFPIVKAMEEMENLASHVSAALNSFSRLCGKICDDIINESYDGLIAEIRKDIDGAEDAMKRLERIVPPRFSNAINVDAISSKIKILSEILDARVKAVNASIYELILSDKWTSEVPPECKTLYKDLMGKIWDFCVYALRLVSNRGDMIPRTKSIFGKQICPAAKAASVTEINRTYDWITHEQFNFGMESSDLKKLKI